MQMVYSYKGFIPVVHPSSYIHPQASVLGNVIIGKDVYVGPAASIRGDFGEIIIEDGCNIQDNCTLHMFPGVTMRLQEGAHIGHGAIIHGAQLGKNTMVGMNAVIMDDVELGDHSIVGALTFVKAGMKIPERSLVVGNPGRIVKELSDEMIEWKTKGTLLYQGLPKECNETSVIVDPLTEIPLNRPAQEILYQKWKDIQGM